MDYKKVILAMGFKEDQLPKDDATDVKEDDLAANLNKLVRESLANDTEFVKPIKQSALGGISGEYQRKLKSQLELDIELKDGETKIDDVIGAIKTKLTSTGNKTVQEVQKQFAEKEKGYESQIELLKKEKSDIENSFKKKEKVNEFNSFVRREMAKQQLTAGADILFPFVKQKLEENYLLGESADGKVTLLDKSGDGKRPQDGHQVLTDEQVILKVLTGEKLIKEKKQTKPDDGIIIEDDPDNNTQKVKFNSEGLQKIKQRLAKSGTN